MNEVNEPDISAASEDVASEKGENHDEYANEPEGEFADGGEAEKTTLAPSEDPSPSPVDALDDGDGKSPVLHEDGGDGRSIRRRELNEMLELDPDVRLSEIPEEVWESGLPLAPAYALYCRRRERAATVAETENRRNREKSPGGIAPMAENYFSPDEVRRMTQSEVRLHYDAILHSMTQWR